MSKSLAEQLAEKYGRQLPEETEPVPSWQPREVKERLTLWDGGIASIKIPRDARLIKSEELGVTYLQFPRTVRGGHVNMFVHGNDPKQCKGEKIIARPEVKRKVFTDGQAYLYVDLHHLNEGEVNCRLIVISGEPKTEIRGLEEPSIFRTPKPLEGAVIVGYIGR